MPTQVVTYEVGDSTKVSFEIEATDGFRSASSGEVIGRVRDAVGPAVEAAKAVLDKVKEARPDEVEVTFGIKVRAERTGWWPGRPARPASRSR